MIKILIVEDGEYRRERLEEAVALLGESLVSVKNLKDAKRCIQNEHIDGIVTDMKFPNNSAGVAKARAGDCLLEWLEKRNEHIPVLGISTCGFSVAYPYIWKDRMPGYVDVAILKEFIVAIKDHSE